MIKALAAFEEPLDRQISKYALCCINSWELTLAYRKYPPISSIIIRTTKKREREHVNFLE